MLFDGEVGDFDALEPVLACLRFAHIDGLISADPAVYARLPKVKRDGSRTQGLNLLELIRFLQVAQTIPGSRRSLLTVPFAVLTSPGFKAKQAAQSSPPLAARARNEAGS